jgi:hypothetical protein
MIWLGDFFLVLSMILLGMRPKTPLSVYGPYGGWICSFTGNTLFIVPIFELHKPGLMVPPVMFTALSLWNLCKLLRNNS